GGTPDAWETMFGGSRTAERPVPDADRSLLPATPGAEPPAEGEARHGIPRNPPVIRQVSNAFLVCPVEGGMLVVDQHSAHERVNYGRLRARFERDGRNADVQPLMFPEALRLDASSMALLEE